MYAQNWGGGNFCATNAAGLAPEAESCLVPYNVTIYQSYNNPGDIPEVIPLGNGTQYMNGTCYAPAVIPDCGTEGHVQLPFGAPEYVGLGFLVFVLLVIIEIFGSPFMRNAGGMRMRACICACQGSAHCMCCTCCICCCESSGHARAL